MSYAPLAPLALIPGWLRSDAASRRGGITLYYGSHLTSARLVIFHCRYSDRWRPRSLLGRALRVGSRQRVLSRCSGEGLPRGTLFTILARSPEGGDPAGSAAAATLAENPLRHLRKY